MKELKEIYELIRKHQGKAEEALKLTPDQNGLVKTFVEHLKNNSLRTEKEAAQELLGVDPSHYSYRRLKKKVRNALLNALFFIDFPPTKFSAIQRAFYESYKLLLASRFLIGRGAHKAALVLEEELLKKSRKHQFTWITYSLLPHMIRQTAIQQGNSQKIEKLYQLGIETHSILLVEMKATYFFSLLTNEYHNSQSYKPEIQQKADQYLQELAPYENNINSFDFHNVYYIIGVIKWLSAGDFEANILWCQRALKYLEINEIQNNVIKANFLLYLITSLIQIKRYSEAEEEINNCHQLISPNIATYWIRLHELDLLLAMHTQKYERAFEIYSKVAESKIFAFQYESRKERWHIYEAYIQYLIKIGLINVENGAHKFRLNKFLNEVPKYSKDQRGFNIPILIIQTLLLVNQKKYDEAVGRIEALEKYTTRYLLKNDTFRSNCFIKMLLIAHRKGFHRAATIRHAEKYIKRLGEAPMEKARQASEIEIIPYETLWEIFINQLDYKIAL